jgi:hypothetical protein
MARNIVRIRALKMLPLGIFSAYFILLDATGADWATVLNGAPVPVALLIWQVMRECRTYLKSISDNIRAIDERSKRNEIAIKNIEQERLLRA